ncbi:MAG: glycosyl hydrolase family 28-related protein [Candidatus Zipacnadales bacterium]
MIIRAASLFLAVTSICGASDMNAFELGVKADGQTDDTAALQAALNRAGETGGGIVYLPPGQYRIGGYLTIPSGVTLQGVWKAPHYSSPEVGTTLLAYAGRGSEDGPPFIMLETNSTIRGVTIYYPEQTVTDLQPYPWTIQGRGTHLNVVDCTLLNPYKGIDFGTYPHEMHYIRNLYGIPLKVGISLDKCTDIGRVENVHFNPNSWTRSGTPTAPTGELGAKLVEYMQANLVAFELGRSDWEFMFNTFVWGAKVGYRFYASERGPTNGNFLGIAADWCVIPLLVEQTQGPGLLITNGEFVGSPTCEAVVQIMPTHTGVLQLSNCSFWGPHRQILRAEGSGVVSLSQCNFCQWAAGVPAIQILSGSLILQASRFAHQGPHIHLERDVTSAVIMGNSFRGGPDISNASQGDVQIVGNVTNPH